jgi:hypothetical protein
MAKIEELKNNPNSIGKCGAAPRQAHAHAHRRAHPEEA